MSTYNATLIKKSALLLCLSITLPSYAVADIESEIKDLKERLQTLESNKKPINYTLYGTLRPVLEYRDEDPDANLDLRDALSHIGVKGSTVVNDSVSAFFRGEWSANLGENGDLGKARLAFAGLDTAFGRIAYGRQRPAQYSLIAEYVDIFNHANSPFAYDSVSPFFVSNFITYELVTKEGIKFLAGVQADGASGEDVADMVNLGVSYDKGGLHLAATYLESTQADDFDEGRETEIYALSAANSFGPFYLALAYQDITYTEVDNSESDTYTIDISSAYSLGNGYKIKAGYFILDEEYDGYNLTLENQITQNVRLHTEYLTRDFDQDIDSFNSLALGIRYDF